MQPPRLDPLPPGLVSLDDHQRHAAQLLDADRLAFFAGAAADGLTDAANRQAWSALQLAPRVLQHMQDSHTRTRLLGRTLDWPLLLAPVAHQRLAHPDGEIGTAFAAQASQTGMVLSTLSNTPVEQVAAILQHEPALAPPLWFQLYLQPDRAATLALLRRAEAAGCQALVLTVDAPVQGIRDAERRHPLQLPPEIRPAHLPPSVHQAGPGLCQGLAASAPGWDDVRWLLEQTTLPLLLKGITHPDDARQAQALGVAGLIVSNHGGRTLDSMPASATLLPRVRQAVGNDYSVLVDGGIRRGTDLFKALALGADAALLGRPQVFGLANAGARGVAHVLRLLRDEFEAAMLLCGCARIAQIDASRLFINR